MSYVILGTTGLTAHIALTKIANAQPGETLVVSSAAGQIGHLAGQIGKILGIFFKSEKTPCMGLITK